MPDQSSASSEHAIMREVAAPLARLPSDPVSIVAHADFPVVLRGYDRDSVDAYVKRTSELVAELHATRSPEIAVRRALERVGEEVAGVLERAHETAERITAQSRREADERLEDARGEAEQITADAERSLTRLDVETDRIWEERGRIVDDMRELADELQSLANSATARLAPAEEPTQQTAILEVVAPLDERIPAAEPSGEDAARSDPTDDDALQEPRSAERDDDA